MSATLADIRLRELAIEPAEYAALQALTPLVCRVSGGGDGGPAIPFRRQHLWRHGISGDRPIVVVAISSVVGLGLLRVVLRAREFWAFAGIAVDVVVLNGEPSSYVQPVADAISPLVSDVAGPASGAGQPASAVFVLRPDEVSSIERLALLAEARMVFDADGRPFEHHVQEALRKRTRDDGSPTAEAVLSPPSEDGVSVRAARGEFHAATGEFVVDVGPQRRPARPWINVIANAQFGFQVSEAGAGFTWAGNSRLHQLTGWSNDPVRDPASEWFVLDEPATRGRWPLLGPQPPLHGLPARVRHGQGYTTFEQDADGIHVEATCFVAGDASVKCTIIRLRNDGRATRHVRVLGVAEWVMGATRGDRRYVVTRKSSDAACLFASRSEHSEPWAGSAAFLAVQDAAADWTCDRRELYANGARVRPATRLAGRAGAGLDPCAALRVARTLAPGDTEQVVFVLGFADDDAAARALAARLAGPRCRRGARRRTAHLDRAARRRGGAHAGPAVRRARQSLAAVPDAVVPALGARRLLPGRRRLRLSRPAAGRDGPRADRAGAAARAGLAARVAAVSRGRRPALVASAGRRRRAHPLHRRSAVAAVRVRALRRRDRRLGSARRARRVARRRGGPAACRGCVLRARESRASSTRCTSTAHARSTSASPSARTACR